MEPETEFCQEWQAEKADVLNDIASRAVPSKFDIYGYIRAVMIGFQLQPEVSCYDEQDEGCTGRSLVPSTCKEGNSSHFAEQMRLHH